MSTGSARQVGRRSESAAREEEAQGLEGEGAEMREPALRARAADGWSVRPVEAADEPRWRELYAGYADFYRVTQSEEMASRVWAWLHDPLHEVEGIVVVDGQGTVQGLAHFRPFARPLSATVGGFLDDLFVDPAARGAGAVDRLLGELRRIGAARGWSVIRWITADDNYRARAKYDQLARRTAWVTYDMDPGG